MQKLERIGYITLIIIIVTLFITASSDSLLKEDDEDVYNFTAIFNQSTDENYVNCKKGMDKAAELNHIDISYQTIYGEPEEEEQEKLILEAVENGAQALIIAPVNNRKLKSFLEKNRINIPVILLASRIESEQVGACIYGNNIKFGEEIAKSILEDNDGTLKEVRAYTKYTDRESTIGMYNGMKSVLEKNKIATSLGDFNKQKLEEQKEGVVVALDKPTLLNIINHNKTSCKIYGVGYNNEIVEALREKRIQSIAICNEYDLGYLSVQKAMQLLKKQSTVQYVEVDPTVLKSDQVYQSQYEAMLFPLS